MATGPLMVTCPHAIWGGFDVSNGDFAYDLVAGNDSRIARREFALYDVQVGTADAAGKNVEQHVAGLGVGSWDILDVERRFADRGWGGEDRGLHARILGVWEHAKRSCIIEPYRKVTL